MKRGQLVAAQPSPVSVSPGTPQWNLLGGLAEDQLEAFSPGLAGSLNNLSIPLGDLGRVRGFLAWLAQADIDGEPIADPAARDRVVALLPYCAGARDSEVVCLVVDDVRISARKGELRRMVRGSDGGKPRMVPVHAELRPVLHV